VKPCSIAPLRGDITEQRQLEDMLRMLSATDELTGLSNRRSFSETMLTEWRRAQRVGYPLSLIEFDLDCFKKFNDTYGHLEGDKCLKLIGSTLGTFARRAGDLVAKYGGEEFLILMPMTNASEATQVAEDIRTSVEALKIVRENNDASAFVTLSLGVASVVPRQDITPEDFISLADKVYQAKREGKNRVVSIDR
jgi:diguanylate cyclase (GGDEF)-like protein